MRILTKYTAAFIISNKYIEDVNNFCYLGSIITTFGWIKEDIKQRIENTKCAIRNIEQNMVFSQYIETSETQEI